MVHELFVFRDPAPVVRIIEHGAVVRGAVPDSRALAGVRQVPLDAGREYIDPVVVEESAQADDAVCTEALFLLLGDRKGELSVHG